MNNRMILPPYILLAVLLVPASLSAQEFLLYKPNPVVEGKAPSSPAQGVLVQRIQVKRGDTLKKISRRHIGVASYFPQVLLFNSIKNPDLIHPGERLLVPVRPGHGAAGKAAKHRRKYHAKQRQPVCPKPMAQPVVEAPNAAKAPGAVVKAAPPAPAQTRPAAALGEQESFQQAKRAYLNGQYQKALDLFDAFLRKYPKSALAADASLYRADSLFRLSAQ